MSLWVTLGSVANFTHRAIGLMSKVLTKSRGDRGSIPRQVIPKTKKSVLNAALLNTQSYKVRIKGKVEQSRERSNTFHYAFVCNKSNLENTIRKMMNVLGLDMSHRLIGSDLSVGLFKQVCQRGMLYCHVNTTIVGSRTAQPPVSSSQSLRITTHGQQLVLLVVMIGILTLCGGVVGVF